MELESRLRFPSRRSAVLARQGMVATSQPLAALAGLRVLMEGGNAADAAVTVAAMLNVVEPMSTGIGGDCFALVFEAGTGQVTALNGSGRAPTAFTLEEAQRRGLKEIPATTPESDAMSRALKKRGFKFVGSTICYAFMQAAGLVNDHTVDCFRHQR